MRWKAPRPSGTRCPSRGDEGTRAFGRCMRAVGGSSPLHEASATVRGVRAAHSRRGTFTHVDPAAAGGETGEGPFSRVVRPAPLSIRFQRPSPQTVVGVRRCPQAASRLGVDRQVVVRPRFCNAGGGGLVELVAARGIRTQSSDGASFDGGRSSWLRKGPPLSATSANDGRMQASRFAAQLAPPRVEVAAREQGARECVRALEIVAEVVGHRLVQRAALRFPGRQQRLGGGRRGRGPSA